MSTLAYGVLGASFLWPWNALLSASALARQKLEDDAPKLFVNFSSTVMTTSSLVNLLANAYLANKPFNYRWRVVYGEVFIAVSFLVLAIVSDLLNAPSLWFILVVLVVLASSVGCALVQNGILAITQHISDPQYALSMLNGQAVAGVMPALLPLIVSGASASGSSGSTLILAMFTFLSVTVLSGASLYLFKDKRNERFVEMAENAAYDELPTTTPSNSSTNSAFNGDTSQFEQQQNVEENPSTLAIFKLIEAPSIAILLGFGSSLCYPVFANTVKSRSLGSEYFQPITHLVWNSGDLIGRIICSSSAKYRITNPKLLISYGALRFLFVALFILNSWLNNPSDILYWLLMLLFGVTSGHLISSAIAAAPLTVPPKLQPAAGGVLGLVISVGLLIGSAVSFLVVLFI